MEPEFCFYLTADGFYQVNLVILNRCVWLNFDLLQVLNPSRRAVVMETEYRQSYQDPVPPARPRLRKHLEAQRVPLFHLHMVCNTLTHTHTHTIGWTDHHLFLPPEQQEDGGVPERTPPSKDRPPASPRGSHVPSPGAASVQVCFCVCWGLCGASALLTGVCLTGS